MVLDSLSIEATNSRLIKEDFRDDNFLRNVIAVVVWCVRCAVRGIALWKSSGITEPGRIEERMDIIDACIDIPNLDAGSCIGTAARRCPGTRCIYDFVTLTQVGMVESVILSLLHHRCTRDQVQRRSVKLNGNCIE